MRSRRRASATVRRRWLRASAIGRERTSPSKPVEPPAPRAYPSTIIDIPQDREKEPVAGFPTALETGLADRYRLERELGRGGMAHGLPRPRSPARPPGRAQGAPSRARRRPRRRALPARDPDRRPAPASRTSCRCSTPAKRATARPLYAMPFVEGESLRDRLRRERQLPVDEAAPDRARGRRGARLRPPARRRPPRHQAREHPALRGARAGGRLRHRARGAERRRRRAPDRDRAWRSARRPT